MKFSNHLRNDRSGRINFIMNTIGFGRIIKAVAADRDNKPAWRCISDTGVMVITNGERNTVVTMWIATVNQLKQIYCDEVIPENLYNKVVANMIYQKDQRKA